MSTPSERLEATIWLESLDPDVPPELTEKFFAGVDEYYATYPIADRGPDIFAILREEDEAFARILRAVLPEDFPSVALGDFARAAPLNSKDGARAPRSALPGAAVLVGHLVPTHARQHPRSSIGPAR